MRWSSRSMRRLSPVSTRSIRAPSLSSVFRQHPPDSDEDRGGGQDSGDDLDVHSPDYERFETLVGGEEGAGGGGEVTG